MHVVGKNCCSLAKSISRLEFGMEVVVAHLTPRVFFGTVSLEVRER